MSKDDIAAALQRADAALMVCKTKKSMAAADLMEAEHNIAMLLVTITELRAAQAVEMLEMAD